jgi:hypothetical protein
VICHSRYMIKCAAEMPNQYVFTVEEKEVTLQ